MSGVCLPVAGMCVRELPTAINLNQPAVNNVKHCGLVVKDSRVTRSAMIHCTNGP